MNEVVTVLDAHVTAAGEGPLRAAYREAAAGPFPAGLLRSTLLRDANDPSRWRIETVWRSHEALAAMRGAGKPRGVQIFEAAGAQPGLSVFTAVDRLAPTSADDA